MSAIILRRPKLGRTSCKFIAGFMQQYCRSRRNDKRVPLADVVFRWGCTSTVAGDPKIINKAEAIHLVNDKAAFRKVMQDANPELVPKTSFAYFDKDIEYPCIVRPARHAQGKRLYKCNSPVDLEDCLTNNFVIGEGYYISKYIPKVAEYRVAVVNGRAVWVAKKTPANPEAIAWNVARGGRFDNVGWKEWPLKVVKTAIEAFNLSGLDFGGVDVMVDAEGKAYVLEINSAPSQTSPYRQECFAKAFDYIIANGNANIPLVQEKGGYKKFIHPAICTEATLANT